VAAAVQLSVASSCNCLTTLIKVLHVIHSFSAGGLENGVVNLINGSPDGISHSLCLLSHSGEFLDRLKRPFQYYELRKRPGNDPSVIFQLLEVSRQSKADIIHTRNWAGFDGILAACLIPHVKVVHSEHGWDMSDPQGINRCRNFLRRVFAFRVRKFVAVSADLRRWLAEVVGVPADKLEFIPNGVDTERFAPARNAELRGRFGLREDDFVVGCIGRLDPVKNLPGVVRAARSLEETDPSVRLMIVGDGPQRADVEKLIGELRFRRQPVLAGQQSRVEDFYGVFDVFALNSFAEGMSNTLLEAMASGLPTVCTRVGGNLELVEDNRRGRLVPVGDDEQLAAAIREYQFRPALRREHGMNARQFVIQTHSLAQMIQRYVQVYRHVLNLRP
jgi:sugar transferase (PEP-CTERM/EpsH1 system associated)